MEQSDTARKRRETFLRRFENQNKSVNNNSSNTNIDNEDTAAIPLLKDNNESNNTILENATTTTTGATFASKENNAIPIENKEQQQLFFQKKMSNLEDETKSSTEEEKEEEDEGSKKIRSSTVVNFVSEDIEKIQSMSHKATTNSGRSFEKEAVVDHQSQSQAQIVKYLSTCGISISDFKLEKVDRSSLPFFSDLLKVASSDDDDEMKKASDSENTRVDQKEVLLPHERVLKDQELELGVVIGRVARERAVMSEDEESSVKGSLVAKTVNTDTTLINQAEVSLPARNISSLYEYHYNNRLTHNSTWKQIDFGELTATQINDFVNDDKSLDTEEELKTQRIIIQKQVDNVVGDDVTTANSANNETSTSTTIPTTNTEKWQSLLIQKIDEQNQAILKCQKQIDCLAQLVTALATEQLDRAELNNLNNSKLKQGGGYPNQHLENDVGPQPTPTELTFLKSNEIHTNTTTKDSKDEVRSPPPRLKMFHSFQSIFAFNIQLPKTCSTYFLSSRPARLFRLLREEAKNHDVRLLDINVLFKVFFVIFVFSSRIKRWTGDDDDDDDDDGDGDGDVTWMIFRMILRLWQRNKIFLFGVGAVIMYILQTGMIHFFWRVLVKEEGFTRIWNNDDLLPKDGRDSNNDRNGDHPPNGNNNVVRERRRRGRRDRMLPDGAVGLFQEVDHNNIPGIQGNNPQHPNQDQNADAQVHRFHNTIFSGYIHRRRFQENGTQDRVNGQNRNETNIGNNNLNIHPNNQNAVLQERDHNMMGNQRILNRVRDYVEDVMYFFISFFLSFIPLWKPRQPQVREAQVE